MAPSTPSGSAPSGHPGRDARRERWRARPVLSLLLRLGAIAVPAACGLVVAYVLESRYPSPGSGSDQHRDESMFLPLVGLAPGIPGGRPGQPFRPDPIYVPTVVEWGVLLGVASFVGFLITLDVRAFVIPRSDA